MYKYVNCGAGLALEPEYPNCHPIHNWVEALLKKRQTKLTSKSKLLPCPTCGKEIPKIAPAWPTFYWKISSFSPPP